MIAGSSLTVPYVMSKADTESRGDAAVDAASMGTGYLRFVSHAEDTDFVFTRNDDYHNAWSRTPAFNAYTAASYKRRINLVRPEPLSRIAGIEAREIDVAYLLSADVVAPIADDPKFKVEWGWSSTATTNILPNLNIADSPFHDERVRRALNHAVNKQTIIDNLLTGEEDVSYGLSPGMLASPIEALRAIGPYAYDAELAKALLAEAGYEDGFSTTLYYPPDWAGPSAPIALAAQQDFVAVGVKVELRGLPTGEFFGVARSLESQGLFLFPFGLGAEQQDNLGALYISDGTYALATYDDLEDAYQAQLRGVDIDERTAAMEDLLVGRYEKAEFIYLVEMRAAHAMAANGRPAPRSSQRDGVQPDRRADDVARAQLDARGAAASQRSTGIPMQLWNFLAVRLLQAVVVVLIVVSLVFLVSRLVGTTQSSSSLGRTRRERTSRASRNASV